MGQLLKRAGRFYAVRQAMSQGPLTQQEVADLMGLSRWTVQRIEARALRKLKTALEARGLTAEEVGAALFPPEREFARRVGRSEEGEDDES